MKETFCNIKIGGVTLIYDLYYDKTTTLKEYVVNFLSRRKYVDQKVGRIYALNKCNLEIKHGDRIGIIGLNGSGKSTLLKVISGLLKPSGGHIDVLGSVQPLIEVGAGFNIEFSGRDNIYLNGSMLGFTKKQIQEKEQEIIDFTELGHFIDVPVKYYSTGMAMRLAFTIATIIYPEILLVDEIISTGDVEFMQKAEERIDKLLTSAKILVLVSHDMNLVRSLVRRVVVMHKGEIIFDGSTEEGIAFYLDNVAKIVEQKEEDKAREEKVSITSKIQEEQAIIITHTALENKSRNGKEILPDDDVLYTIDFKTDRKFREFYASLFIQDRAGVVVAHIRNDMSAVDIKDLKEGSYSINIPIHKIPFKSAQYRYQFRLVGSTDRGEAVQETEKTNFVIGGNKSKHTFIDHEWIIEKK
jgi:lipopolysaccharide transport system ATP-binding protein